MKFRLHPKWLPEKDKVRLLQWVRNMMARNLAPLTTHSSYGIQFRGRPPEFYLQEGALLEEIKERIRQQFGLKDHPEAEPGWKVWVSVMPEGSFLPMHQHVFRKGCGDLRVNILVQKAEMGGLAGYVDEQHDPDECDLWFLDGVKNHWVSEVVKGTRILISYGFDMPQDEINRMGV